MHTYQRTEKEPALWTVYFMTTAGKYPLKDFKSEKAAAAFTSYLNGGEFYDWEVR